MNPQLLAGVLLIAAGIVLIVVSRLLMRRVDRLVDFQKSTQLTKIGERMVTPTTVGCQLLLMTPVGIAVVVVGVWVAVAAFW